MKVFKTKKQSKIRTKLTQFFGGLIIITVLLVSTIAFYELTTAHNSAIIVEQQKFDSIIQVSTQNLISVLTVNHQRYLDGEITQEQEMEFAKKIVRNTRYGNDGNGYFWADLEDGTCAIHINPEYEGQQRYDNQDMSGNYYIRNLIKAGNENGGGFTEFYFTKPGQEGAFKKRAFTQKFDPYGWYISTGNYYDDIEKTIDIHQKDKYFSGALIIGSGMLMCLIGATLVIFYANKIAGYLNEITQRLIQFSKGDLHTPVLEITSGDEFEMLSLATKQSVDNLSSIISDIDDTMSEFSNGNFTGQSHTNFIGDFAHIQKSIEKFQAKMNDTLVELDTASAQVSSGASQVADGAQVLARGATEQTSSVEELSATIADISHQISQTAQYSENANALGKQVGEVVQKSQVEMKKMMEAIKDIASDSENIKKIIKVIDDIAFQTNILALNAAVEAARAGNAGKGFAVVADEVRNLAQKSAEAAKDTTELIENSLQHVSLGEKLAVSTDTTFEEAAKYAEDILRMVAKIAQASNEQALSISQISQGVDQISSVVQMNSATSEESAAASEELSGQAGLMKSLIDQFELSNTTKSIYDTETKDTNEMEVTLNS